MKAQTMERLLAKHDWWSVERQGWPSHVCFRGNELIFLLMKENNKGFVDRALRNGLRCYERIVNNDYRLLKERIEDYHGTRAG